MRRMFIQPESRAAIKQSGEDQTEFGFCWERLMKIIAMLTPLVLEFYYWSELSLVPLGIAYAVVGVFFGIVVAVSKSFKRGRAAFLAAVGTILLVLPVSEELWIAWNFGQACRDAGTFIYKTVQVDGFYDDTRTTHAGVPMTQAVQSFNDSGYQFLEMRGQEKFVRLEKIDGQWRAMAIDGPTARYWFQESDGEKVTHKVGAQQSTVTDTQSNEVIARYVRYHRQAPWYFVSVAAPAIACDKPGGRQATGSFLIYRNVLQPAAK